MRTGATRERVLAALRAARTPRTLTELAHVLGVHVNTVRFHVVRLVGDGLAERVAPEPVGPGRPAVRVRATRRRDHDDGRAYRSLAHALTSALADAPDRAARAERAGHAWGERLAGDLPPSEADTRLMHVLDNLSFAPTQPSPTEIDLHDCPFLDVATAAPDIVCSVHLGLMRGALDATRSGLQVTRLDPLVRPGLCVAHLGRGPRDGSAAA